MNTDILKGKWQQWVGSAKTEWGKLTDDELQKIDGEKDRLVGVVQEKYGLARGEAEKQVDDWIEKSEVD